MLINNRMGKIERTLNERRIELARKAQEAIDRILDQMTDDELEILAYTEIEAWPDDFSRRWLEPIKQAEIVLGLAEKIGVVIDELQ